MYIVGKDTKQKRKNGRNSVTISSILQLFVDYYIKAANSFSLIMVSLGHETVLKTSKCLSLVTMSSASAAIAQSTNLLSSGSSVINRNLENRLYSIWQSPLLHYVQFLLWFSQKVFLHIHLGSLY